MKKLFWTVAVFVGFAFTLSAQEIRPNAIGVRIGDNDGFGGEISYQRAIGSNNRLEFDLGWRDQRYYDAVKLVGLYQWVWNIDGGFNWYAGPGLGIGRWDYNGPRHHPHHNDPHWDDSGSFFLIAGNIGIEYVFDIPLQLSLDFRPEIYFGDDRDDFDRHYNSFGPDIALGVRFTF